MIHDRHAMNRCMITKIDVMNGFKTREEVDDDYFNFVLKAKSNVGVGTTISVDVFFVLFLLLRPALVRALPTSSPCRWAEQAEGERSSSRPPLAFVDDMAVRTTFFVPNCFLGADGGVAPTGLRRRSCGSIPAEVGNCGGGNDDIGGGDRKRWRLGRELGETDFPREVAATE